ncbi:MAG: hypothetical protein GF317_07410 [Candidatus Lokiarchaeota archaeon]|nr:hypothetical protein [Candidatus Lokiarchaeota archaeon]MBD3199536.1 hypothetical protein [Candidatus Lokiarchaeota archaeon]
MIKIEDLLGIFAVSILLVFIGTLFFLGIYLIIRAYQTSEYKILFVSCASFSIAIGFIGSNVLSLGRTFEEVFVVAGFISLSMFTFFTFHRSRKRTFLVLLSIIILGILLFITKSLFVIFPIISIGYFYKILDTAFTFLVFFWLGFSSYKIYRSIKEYNVQHWIKFRYKVISFTSFITSFQTIPELFLEPSITYTDTENIIVSVVFMITLFITIIFSSGFLLAWFIPDSLKKYLNRDYQVSESLDMPEEELYNLIRRERNHPKKS